MPYDPLNLGTSPDDRTGDNWRTGGEKINAMTAELYDSVAANTVYINSADDLPNQTATTITFEPFTLYTFGAIGEIVTDKTSIMGEGTVLEGAGQTIPAFSYIGVGVMFQSIDIWVANNLNFSCPNGSVFAATGTNFVTMRNSTCSECLRVGTFTGAGFFGSGSTFGLITQQGFVFSGASDGYLFETGSSFSPSASYIGVDLGSATTNLFRILNATMAGVAGGVAVSGLVSSGNINAGKRAEIDDSDLEFGGITPLQNITEDDVRWFVSKTVGLRDSSNKVNAYLTPPASLPEIITVSAASTFYEIGVPAAVGVSWASDIARRFELGTDGVMTYIGEVSITEFFLFRCTVEKVGGGADEIEVRLAKNWAGGADTGIEGTAGTTQDSSKSQAVAGGNIDLETGDNVRVIFANNGSTANINIWRCGGDAV